MVITGVHFTHWTVNLFCKSAPNVLNKNQEIQRGSFTYFITLQYVTVDTKIKKYSCKMRYEGVGAKSGALAPKKIPADI